MAYGSLNQYLQQVRNLEVIHIMHSNTHTGGAGDPGEWWSRLSSKSARIIIDCRECCLHMWTVAWLGVGSVIDVCTLLLSNKLISNSVYYFSTSLFPYPNAYTIYTSLYIECIYLYMYSILSRSLLRLTESHAITIVIVLHCQILIGCITCK